MSVVRCGPETCTDEPAEDVGVVDVAIVHIDPLGSNDLATCLQLLISRSAVINSHVIREIHFYTSTCAHQLEIK